MRRLNNFFNKVTCELLAKTKNRQPIWTFILDLIKDLFSYFVRQKMKNDSTN